MQPLTCAFFQVWFAAFIPAALAAASAIAWMNRKRERSFACGTDLYPWTIASVLE